MSANAGITIYRMEDGSQIMFSGDRCYSGCPYYASSVGSDGALTVCKLYHKQLYTVEFSFMWGVKRCLDCVGRIGK